MGQSPGFSICPRRPTHRLPATRDSKLLGNFSNYYSYRYAGIKGSLEIGVAADPRIRVLKSAVGAANCLAGGSLIDIGSNSGEFTLAVAKLFRCRKVIGLEIDGKLVQEAELHRSQAVGFDASAVEFAQSDFLEWTCPVAPVDAVLCLSVTKWIHLQHGDAGIRRLFQLVWQCLRPGGLFVLEAQNWRSYGKARYPCANKAHNLMLRPSHFAQLLTSENGGFQKERHHFNVPHKKAAFKRTMLFLWRKDAPSCCVEVPHVSSMDGGIVADGCGGGGVE